MTINNNPNIKDKRLSPLLKWAGGKEQELKHIYPYIPTKVNNYFEPFVGGGAVYFSMKVDKMFINDKSYELIDFYKAVLNKESVFFETINDIINNWDKLKDIVLNNEKMFIDNYKKYSQNMINETTIESLIISFISKYKTTFIDMFYINSENFLIEIKKNLLNKIKRMKKIEKEKGILPNTDIIKNIESALKSAFYMQFRYLYNNVDKYNITKNKQIAIFFFIRNFSYSGMFRYNNHGDFNVPYGGIGYNNKNLNKKVLYLQDREILEHLNKTIIDNLDFEEFFIKNTPKGNDFIFLDPPYDSEFSTYSNNKFDKEDQLRLSKYLINDCKANWLMIIKETSFIYNLYNQENIYINTFDKKYLVNIQNRNNKKAKHLIITNYNILLK